MLRYYWLTTWSIHQHQALQAVPPDIFLGQESQSAGSIKHLFHTIMHCNGLFSLDNRTILASPENIVVFGIFHHYWDSCETKSLKENTIAEAATFC